MFKQVDRLYKYGIYVLFVSGLTISMTACGAKQKVDNTQKLFAQSVESCICNYLDLEDDHPSGLTYDDFIQDCNQSVRDSHPTRFVDSEDSNPEIETLRCPEKVESWLEVIEEQEKLRENNRNFFQNFLESTTDEDPDSDTKE